MEEESGSTWEWMCVAGEEWMGGGGHQAVGMKEDSMGEKVGSEV